MRRCCRLVAAAAATAAGVTRVCHLVAPAKGRCALAGWDGCGKHHAYKHCSSGAHAPTSACLGVGANRHMWLSLRASGPLAQVWVCVYCLRWGRCGARRFARKCVRLLSVLHTVAPGQASSPEGAAPSPCCRCCAFPLGGGYAHASMLHVNLIGMASCVQMGLQLMGAPAWLSHHSFLG